MILAPDADLGGVRIAHRIAEALPADIASLTIVDAGAVPHPPVTRTFGPPTRAALRRVMESSSPAAALAAACLSRGYPVEQEAVIRAAVSARTMTSHRNL